MELFHTLVGIFQLKFRDTYQVQNKVTNHARTFHSGVLFRFLIRFYRTGFLMVLIFILNKEGEKNEISKNVLVLSTTYGTLLYKPTWATFIFCIWTTFGLD